MADACYVACWNNTWALSKVKADAKVLYNDSNVTVNTGRMTHQSASGGGAPDIRVYFVPPNSVFFAPSFDRGITQTMLVWQMIIEEDENASSTFPELGQMEPGLDATVAYYDPSGNTSGTHNAPVVSSVRGQVSVAA